MISVKSISKDEAEIYLMKELDREVKNGNVYFKVLFL
jgi:hypothetical protein